MNLVWFIGRHFKLIVFLAGGIVVGLHLNSIICSVRFIKQEERVRYDIVWIEVCTVFVVVEHLK